MNSLNRTSIVFALLAGLVSFGCASSGGNQPEYEEKPIVHQVSESDIAMTKSDQAILGSNATLWVNGMGCPLCASNLDIQLKRLKGVGEVAVDLSIGVVTVDLKPGVSHPSPARLGEAVEDAGFTLVKIQTQ